MANLTPAELPKWVLDILAEKSAAKFFGEVTFFFNDGRPVRAEVKQSVVPDSTFRKVT
jgi:hypothetical protein